MSSPAKTAVKSYQNYVNGQWVSSSTGETFPVFDPSTEEVIAQVAAASTSDVDKAVKAARAAFDSGPWPATTAQDRGRILFKLAEKIRQNQPELAEFVLKRFLAQTMLPKQFKPALKALHEVMFLRLFVALVAALPGGVTVFPFRIAAKLREHIASFRQERIDDIAAHCASRLVVTAQVAGQKSDAPLVPHFWRGISLFSPRQSP